MPDGDEESLYIASHRLNKNFADIEIRFPIKTPLRQNQILNLSIRYLIKHARHNFDDLVQHYNDFVAGVK